MKILINKLPHILLLLGIFLLNPTIQAHATLYPFIKGDNSYEWITNVTFGTINKSSAQNYSGYGDYTYDKTKIMTRVKPGNTYTLSVTIHPDKEWCDEYIHAFFDWNKDGDFTDPGETKKVAADTCSPGPHKVNIKIPDTAGGGETRMRIVLKYFSAPKSFGNIPEGEAEDYTLVFNYPYIYGDNRLEWITDVTFSGITDINADRDSNGYGDYSFWRTSKIATVTQDETYALNVTISPDSISPNSGNCYENVTAFVDWNQDGDFKDADENNIVAKFICDATPRTLKIRVPGNAKLGRTLMRVVLRWLLQPEPSGYISGEAEDYTLYVKERKFPVIFFIPAIVGHKR